MINEAYDEYKDQRAEQTQAFLQELPKKIDDEIEKCRQGNTYHGIITYRIPNFNFRYADEGAKAIKAKEVTLAAYLEIKAYCDRPDVNLKVRDDPGPFGEIEIYLNKCAFDSSAYLSDKCKEFKQAYTARINNHLYSKFDNVPDFIQKAKLELPQNKNGRIIKDFIVWIDHNLLRDYEPYQALHEYCSRPEVDVRIWADRDSLYNEHHCKIIVGEKYDRSSDVNKVPLDVTRKLPDPPVISVQPKKKNLWNRLGLK